MRYSARLGVCFSVLFLSLALSSTSGFAARGAVRPNPELPAAKNECASLLSDAVPVAWVAKMISEGKAGDAQVQRMREIVQRIGFTNATLNQAVLRAHNEKYTHQLQQGPPTNQKASGRCWIFAGLNMIRSTLIADGRVPQNFEFSESYVHFFSMLEQSNHYLESVIAKTYSTKSTTKTTARAGLQSAFEPHLADGGWYEHFMFLVTKYGLVPKDAMPETKSSENTSVLLSELKRYLATSAHVLLNEARSIAKEGKAVTEADYLARVRELKEQTMQGVWRILATHLGDPPGQFTYRTDSAPAMQGRTLVTPANVFEFSPRAFAREFVKFDANDYVVVASSPRVKPGVYEQTGTAIGPAEPGSKRFDTRFLNVSLERMEQLAVASIEGGHPLWFAADVGKDVDNATGVMHPEVYERDAVYQLPERQQLDRLNRQLANFFGVTSPNHAMLLTGFDRPVPGGPVLKFKNENSWGDQVGTRGTYHLYAEWFRQNVFQIVVHKKFLSKGEDKAWAGKARQLNKNDEIF